LARPLTLAGVFAHPDDESWSLAGVFAVLVPKGVRGVVWTATRGQAGQIAADSGATRETLPRVREAEERAAMASVGVERVVFGDLVDGQVEHADRDALSAAVHGFLERELPDVVVTMEPGGVTAHPDHMAVSGAVQAAFALHEEPEHALGRIRREALAFVRYAQHRRFAFLADADADAPAGGRELHGVVEQVGEDLLDPRPVRVDPHRRCVERRRGARQRRAVARRRTTPRGPTRSGGSRPRSAVGAI